MIRGGTSRLLEGIDVFVDFVWDLVIGHPQRTFINYLSLKEYILRHTKYGRRPALLLTNQKDKREGCITNHNTYDIFVVNILSYKSVAKNDAAGAYFAGLQGSPIIDLNGLSNDQKDSLFENIIDAEWVKRNSVRIAPFWSEIGGIFLEGAKTPELVDELTKRTDTLSSGDLGRIEEFLASPDFPSNILETASLMRRREAVNEFERELNRNEWKERDWQKFFKREKWIFGHGLLYNFLEIIGSEVYVGGKDLTNKNGRVADYAVTAKGKIASFFALVEIKIPDTILLGQVYRNRAYSIHEDLGGAVSQIIGMCDEWSRTGSKEPDNHARAIEEGWDTAQPRGILVIGHTRQFSGVNDRKRSFELFRRHLHGIEILTFDELFIRAQEIISLDM
jgi:hypothetical protein